MSCLSENKSYQKVFGFQSHFLFKTGMYWYCQKGFGIGFLSCIGIGIVKRTFQVLVLVLVLLSSSAKVLVLVLGRNFGIGQLCPFVCITLG